MKNPVFSLLALLLLGLIFTSCKKDNAALENQLNGHWSSITVRVDAENLTKSYVYDLTLQADKTFSLNIEFTPSEVSGSIKQATMGTWEANEREETLTLQNSETQVATVYNIMSVDESSLIVERIENDKKTEITFVKK